MKRRARVIALAAAAAVLLSGCTQSSEIASITNKGNGQNFVSTTGVDEYPSPTTPVVRFAGPLAGGGTFDSSEYTGKVLVVNFWYAGCGPCRAEAKSLESLSKQYAGTVQFVGINVRDEAGQVTPYERTFGVTYPSILDVDTGSVQLAFATSGRPPNAVPSTYVLDERHRVGARILGGLQNTSTLTSLITTAVAGGD